MFIHNFREFFNNEFPKLIKAVVQVTNTFSQNLDEDNAEELLGLKSKLQGFLYHSSFTETAHSPWLKEEHSKSQR